MAQNGSPLMCRVNPHNNQQTSSSVDEQLTIKMGGGSFLLFSLLSSLSASSWMSYWMMALQWFQAWLPDMSMSPGRYMTWLYYRFLLGASTPCMEGPSTLPLVSWARIRSLAHSWPSTEQGKSMSPTPGTVSLSPSQEECGCMVGRGGT